MIPEGQAREVVGVFFLRNGRACFGLGGLDDRDLGSGIHGFKHSILGSGPCSMESTEEYINLDV
jgi:hypothetical protein